MSDPTSPTHSRAAGSRMSPAPRRTARLVVAAWAVATVAAAIVGARGFSIDNSVGVWFAAADPALSTYRRALQDFGHREWILVGLSSTVHEDARSEARDRLAERIEGLPEVHAVLSARDLPPDAPLVRGFLRPRPDAGDEALLVHVTNDLDRQDGYREALVDAIRAAAADLPDAGTVRVAGIAVINGELNRAARRDMIRFFPAVGVLLALIGFALFRNVRDTAVLLSVASGTVVCTIGLLLGTGYPLNMVTIMLPTVLIALSVADSVHLVHAFHAARADGRAAAAAARAAVRSIALPCAGTTLTTMAGFLAFSGSSVLPVFQMAVFGSLGVALAWALTVTGGAALLALLWDGRTRRTPAATRLGSGAVERWWRFVGARPQATIAAFALAAASLAGLNALVADTDYVRFFREGTRVPAEYAALQRAGFPQNPLDLILELPAGPDALATYWQPMDSLARRLEEVPGVRAVLSPFALAPSPAALGAVGHRLGMLSEAGDRVQLTAMTDYPSSRRLLHTLDGVRALAAEILPPEVQLTATGTSLLWAHMDAGVIRTQRQSLLAVSLVCFLILSLLFRSVRLGVLGLVVSLYPVAVILGLMGLLGIPLNMATVLIAGIAVGLAVDNSIHLMHAWRDSRDRGAGPWRACEVSLGTVGVRLLVTASILVGAFAGMGASDFVPTAQFGILTSITILLALAVDLTLLPVLLAWGHAAPAVAAVPVAAGTAWGRAR
jgi:uncharacterized protein